MIDPHREKYFPLYWEMAYAAAQQSVATRHQVGAVVVTPTGMISPGWNAMPAGLSNVCEKMDTQLGRLKTKPEVIHAERNAIDKMTRQGIPTAGSILFVTRSPCFECSKALHGLGLKAVYYHGIHDDVEGLKLLEKTGTPVFSRNGLRPYGDNSKE